MKYAIVIERAPRNLSAWVPDLPGCVATARSRAALEKRIAAAIEMHVAGLVEDGLPVPEPRTIVGHVRIADARRERGGKGLRRAG